MMTTQMPEDQNRCLRNKDLRDQAEELGIKRKYAQVIHSNNYLRMHHIPMRRKKRGTRKTKRYFFMDEASLLYRVNDTQNFYQELFKRARSFYGKKKVTAVKQRLPLPCPSEE